MLHIDTNALDIMLHYYTLHPVIQRYFVYFIMLYCYEHTDITRRYIMHYYT